MIRTCILGLLLCFSSQALAQANPLLMPVHLHNGRLFDFINGPGDPAGIRKAAIRSICIYTLKRNGEHTDTTLEYIADFTKRGDRIPRHYEFKYFDGFNKISYNRNGTRSAEQWKGIDRAGCGTNGITILYTDYRTDYTYQKKKLVLEVTSSLTRGGSRHDTVPIAGLHTAYTYDKKGRKATEERYRLPGSEKDTFKTIRRFRYNGKGRLIQVYDYECQGAQSQRVMDSLITKADGSLATILLRQSSQWHDTVMLNDFPEPDNETDEAYEIRGAAINYRDSLDIAAMDFYENDRNAFDGFTGYDYNQAGLLSRKLYFNGTDLSRKDVFVYNDKRRLASWVTWHLDYDDDFSAWEQTGFRPLPLHSTWTFTYDTRGRVEESALFQEASTPTNYLDPHYHFRAQREINYILHYDQSGRVDQVLVRSRVYHYDMNPDVIPPVVNDTVRYYIRYETW